MNKLLLIALGGALGALLRYAVSGLTYRFFDPPFPWGTLVVNLAGSLLIGFIWGLSERARLPPQVLPFFATGVLGAFTTFSTYSLECYTLLRDGEVGLALLNFAANNGLGLLLVYLGVVAARALPPGP
jgi:CrcB protein